MFNIRNIQIIEQVNGIEPSFPGWKPGALTIVLYLQTLGFISQFTFNYSF